MERVVAFEPLIPPSAGDAPPCRASLVTSGRLGERELEVVVFDASIAAQALRSGGWAEAELERALSGASALHLPRESPLRSALRARGVELRDELIAIEDFGDLDSEILQNGLFLVEHRPGVLRRPGLVVWSELDGGGLAKALEGWAAQPGLPEKGRAIALSGAGFFRDRGRVDALAEQIAKGPLWLRLVEWSGEGDLRLAIAAVARLVRAWARGPSDEPIQFRAAEAVDARVRALAERLDPIDLGVFARLAEGLREDEALHRRVDDGQRGALFGAIADARRAGDMAGEGRAVVRAEDRLGSAGRFIRAFRRASMDRRPRVTLIPTWECELRCKYCTIPKQGGRVMPLRTLERGIELCLSSDGEEVEIHFFGGEPMSEWESVRHAVEWGSGRAAEEGRRIHYLITTDGFGLTPERLALLARHPVRFQLSLDGDPEIQNAFRPQRGGGASYAESPGGKAAMLLASGLEHEVIQVVHPKNADRMAASFRHIVGLGYRQIQLNYALGTRWDEPAVRLFADGLMEIGRELAERERAGDRVELVNLSETMLPVRGNLEVTVDWDGTVFGTSAFLYIPKYREEFRLGHLDDGASFRRYVHDGLQMDHLLAHWYREGMADNNRSVGAVLMSFVRWMNASAQ